jgi:hypothetical protein
MDVLGPVQDAVGDELVHDDFRPEAEFLRESFDPRDFGDELPQRGNILQIAG